MGDLELENDKIFVVTINSLHFSDRRDPGFLLGRLRGFDSLRQSFRREKSQASLGRRWRRRRRHLLPTSASPTFRALAARLQRRHFIESIRQRR